MVLALTACADEPTTPTKDTYSVTITHAADSKCDVMYCKIDDSKISVAVLRGASYTSKTNTFGNYVNKIVVIKWGFEPTFSLAWKQKVIQSDTTITDHCD